MRYVSTRGGGAPKRFCDILLEGLAEDGGLYLPTAYPRIDEATLTRWRGLPYAELAFEILSLYIDDIPAEDLRRLCAQTYRADGELDDIRANKDCLKKFSAEVTGAGVISASELKAIDDEVLALIEDAVQQAKAAPLPTAADLLTDVYVSY